MKVQSKDGKDETPRQGRGQLRDGPLGEPTAAPDLDYIEFRNRQVMEEARNKPPGIKRKVTPPKLNNPGGKAPAWPLRKRREYTRALDHIAHDLRAFDLLQEMKSQQNDVQTTDNQVAQQVKSAS